MGNFCFAGLRGTVLCRQLKISISKFKPVKLAPNLRVSFGSSCFRSCDISICRSCDWILSERHRREKGCKDRCLRARRPPNVLSLRNIASHAEFPARQHFEILSNFRIPLFPYSQNKLDIYFFLSQQNQTPKGTGKQLANFGSKGKRRG